jgi:aconitate hydratase
VTDFIVEDEDWQLRYRCEMNRDFTKTDKRPPAFRRIWSRARRISIRIDQTLTQDATGTLVMLELEALGLDRVQTDVSVQYVDHNLIQADFKNPDDHLFLQSACQRFGVWYSRPGNGVSHPVHMQRFGKPGATLLGSDSHTPAAGSLGMLAIGAGGLDVAMAMAGQPFSMSMPKSGA